MSKISFIVHGKPIQKGSMRPVPMGKRMGMVADNKKALQQWHGAVSQEAAKAMGGRDLFVGPVVVSCDFYFTRPQGDYGKGRNARRLKPSSPERHAKTPDLDKLLRALLDALSDTVIRDDRQVDGFKHVRKHWTETGARAEITITAENHDG